MILIFQVFLTFFLLNWRRFGGPVPAGVWWQATPVKLREEKNYYNRKTNDLQLEIENLKN
ncbi:hypothetical protein [Alkaliphilus metalliredigens]|uniref:hypothetical protein n=1 Tax=Alkaliphilus metalliredigens TaxID=208226 RepID=UPI0012ED39E1|nr:hypothetical protein [Alkaliphilus metalliredigens]